ncbi:MAG: serine hydrolase [Actinobacteria bacterium]|nr:serine hydrolase [Actinomycetota bacterium]
MDLDGVRLDELASAHGIVGAAIGVSRRGHRTVMVHGTTDLGTGASVRPDTAFLAGSVTKAMTASAVALLVAEGRVGLDEPIRRRVPEFEVADRAATEAITVRHLLTHTSGFDGDIWIDVGEGDDAIERFVGGLGGLAQLSTPGSRFSYNNAGYAVLGRLLERVERATFEEVLQHRVALPSGARFTTDPTHPRHASSAVGHLRSGDGSNAAVTTVIGPACLAPAGARTWADVDDLLGFGEWHLGHCGDPHHRAALRAMRAPQIVVADPNNAATMGLGIFVDDDRWGTPVVFHDGGVNGQSAYLRILPEDDAVLVVVSTGGVPQTFHRHAFRAMAAAALGRTAPLGAVADPGVVLDADRYVGTYAASVTEVEIDHDAGGLGCTITYAPGTDHAVRTDRLALSAVDHRVMLAPLDGRDYVVVFPPLDEPCDHLLAALRMLVRR